MRYLQLLLVSNLSSDEVVAYFATTAANVLSHFLHHAAMREVIGAGTFGMQNDFKIKGSKTVVGIELG